MYIHKINPVTKDPLCIASAQVILFHPPIPPFPPNLKLVHLPNLFS